MKKIATGTYNPETGAYKMHAPEFPYHTTVYIGYTLEGMKQKYRADHDLKYKRIEWIIL